jgi:predicted secreted protein
MILRCATAGLVLACVTTAALAGDAAARKVIGFSPDGAYFAFEQYTMVYEDEASFSEYVIVDTKADKLVPGTPVRILLRGDDGLDEKKARADAQGKAKPLLDRFKIGEPGTRIEGKPSMELDDIGIYQINQQPMARSLDIPLPDGRKARIAVSRHPIATVMCEGMGGRGTPGPAKGYGVKLTLKLADSPPIILQHDKALPKSRRCAFDYGIAEAYLHQAGDGALTLAALIEYSDNDDHHAGPNRRFMAVTKKLPKP